MKGVPLVQEYQLREYLNNLDIHKSMSSDGMHPLKLMEAATVIASQHSFTSRSQMLAA